MSASREPSFEAQQQVPGFQGSNVATLVRFQGRRVPRLQGSKFPSLQGSSIPIFQGSKHRRFLTGKGQALQSNRKQNTLELLKAQSLSTAKRQLHSLTKFQGSGAGFQGSTRFRITGCQDFRASGLQGSGCQGRIPVFKAPSINIPSSKPRVPGCTSRASCKAAVDCGAWGGGVQSVECGVSSGECTV